jgi:cytochrome P450 family 110
MPQLPNPPIVEASNNSQVFNWTFHPVEFLEDCGRKYGDCFVVKMSKAAPDWVILSNPEGLAELFMQKSHQFDTGRGNQIVGFSVGENSTLLLDGAPHQKRRQLLMPPFHGERMKNYGDTIRQITEDMTRNWVPNERFTMIDYTKEITFQVILQTVFGLRQGDRYDEIQRLLNQYLAISASPILYPVSFFPFLLKKWGPINLLGGFMKLRKLVDDLLFAEIADRRETLDPDRSDILTLLLMARDEDGNAMTDQELRDELMTMLLAGHDSSAATLAWTFYYLYTHPEAEAKLTAELDALGPNPDPTAISKLPYLNAVCSETLRLRSAGPTVAPRISKEPVTIAGYKFPENTIFLPCNYLTHHRAEIYPEPYSFKPERFVDRQYAPNEYFPFGGGNRRCIGAAFSMYEMKIVIATIVQNNKLKMAQKTPIKTVRRGVNISPDGGVKMVMTERRSRSVMTPEMATL